MFPGDLAPIRSGISKYWKGNRTASDIPAKNLKLLVKKEAGSSWSRVQHIVNEILEVPAVLDSATESVVEGYIHAEVMRNMALRIAEDVERNAKPNPLQVIKDLRSMANALDTDGEVRTIEYKKGGVDYWKHIEGNRVSTGLGLLNEALGGGLGPGELGLIIGPYSGGKTTCLINFGAHAVLSGLNVYHLTLEINKWQTLMRYDMRLGGYQMKELKGHPTRIKRARSMAKGVLIIRDSSHERVSPGKLEGLIERLEVRPDLILVDYADLMSADRFVNNGESSGRRFELGEIYRDLRRIASSKEVPIWTASQATREASRTGEFTGADVAEDISKLHTVDAAICLNQTFAQREDGFMVVRVDKTRMSETRPFVPVGVDYSRMLFYEKGEEEDAS